MKTDGLTLQLKQINLTLLEVPLLFRAFLFGIRATELILLAIPDEAENMPAGLHFRGDSIKDLFIHCSLRQKAFAMRMC